MSARASLAPALAADWRLGQSRFEDWLRERDPARLAALWRAADLTRAAQVGDEVHLRGLVELSSFCVRACAYCGLRAGNRALERYRLTRAEILECARQAVRLGYGTLVLQSGEDPGLEADGLADIIREVKATTPLAVTLSLGERDELELRLWRRAGADRYLLRFETSNPALFDQLHPARPGQRRGRRELLGLLRELGYSVGSGVMVGLPGQSWANLAADVGLFASLELDMIGVGPYLPHPRTPLAASRGLGSDEQVPADALTTTKVIALARLTCLRASIPSTTALATLEGPAGRELALRRGANVWMPNLTPLRYRRLYDIYPGKAATCDDAITQDRALGESLARLGRRRGTGRGDARRRAGAASSVGAGAGA